MCGALALIFVVVPAVELVVLLNVGSLVGLGATLGVIVLTALLGAWLIRHQGFLTLRELQTSMLTGQPIGSSVLGAALVLVAGVLLIAPGLLTDAVGLALLAPQVRRMVARSLRKGLERRIARGDAVVFPMGGPARRASRESGAWPNRPHDQGGADDRSRGGPPVIDV